MTAARFKKKWLNVGQSLPTCCWWDWSYWAFQRGLTHLEPLRGTAEWAAVYVRLQCYAKVSKAGGEAVVCCVMSEFGGKSAGSSFRKKQKISRGLLLAVACWCHCFQFATERCGKHISKGALSVISLGNCQMIVSFPTLSSQSLPPLLLLPPPFQPQNQPLCDVTKGTNGSLRLLLCCWHHLLCLWIIQ